jgi:hypothetical protein
MADVSAEFMADLKARLAATMDAMRNEPDDGKRMDIATRAALYGVPEVGSPPRKGPKAQ